MSELEKIKLGTLKDLKAITVAFITHYIYYNFVKGIIINFLLKNCLVSIIEELKNLDTYLNLFL